MAFPLMRDPASGRMLSRFETLSRMQQQQAATIGQTKSEGALSLMEVTLSHETPGVQAYVKQVLDIVRQHMDSPKTLKAVKAVIADFTSNIAKDTMLTTREKARTQDYLGQVRAWVRERTSLVNRASRRVVGSARDKAAGIAEQLAGSGGNRSLTFSGIAKVLQRRDRGKDREFAESASEAYGSLAERDKQQKLQAKQDAKPDLTPERAAAPASTSPTRAKKGAGASDNDFDSALLGAVARGVNRTADEVTNVYEVVSKIHTLMQRDRDDRAREAGAKTDKPKSFISRVKDKAKQGTSLLGNLMGLVGGKLMDLVKGLGLGSLGSLISSALLPALKLMGVGAAVIGAAWAGWKVGQWIDKMTGASNVVEAVATKLNQKFFGAKTDGDVKTEWDAKEIAQGRELSKGHYIPVSVEDARAFRTKLAEGLRAGKSQDEAIYAAIPDKQKPVLWNPTAKKPAETTQSMGSAPATPPASSQPLPAPVSPPTPVAPAPVVPQSPERVPNVPKVNTPAPTSPVKVPTPATSMRMSDKGLSALLKREGLPRGQKEGGPYTAYPDVGGVWTIGHGLTTVGGKKVTQGMTITGAEEREEIRRQLTQKYEPIVRKNLGGKAVPQDVFDSLVSVAYNTERGGANLAKKIARGQSLTKDDFMASATVKGARHRGLENRRETEFKQYASAAEFAPAQPNAMRSTPSVASMASAAGAPSVTVVAPQMTLAQGGNGSTPVMMPVPMQTENPDATIRAIRSVNGV